MLRPPAVETGGKEPWVSWKLCQARPNCLRLLVQLIRAAASRTFCTAGSSRPIRIAMMAITTSNSISVKPPRGTRPCDWDMIHSSGLPGSGEGCVLGAGCSVLFPRRGPSKFDQDVVGLGLDLERQLGGREPGVLDVEGQGLLLVGDV